MPLDDLKEGIGTVLGAAALISGGLGLLILLVAVLTGNTDKIVEWGAGQIVDAVQEAVMAAILGALRAVGAALVAVFVAVRTMVLVVAAAVAVVGAMVKAVQESLGF